METLRDYDVFSIPKNLLDKQQRTAYDQRILDARNCLNVDEVFKHSRDFFDGQLKALNDTIFQNKRDLFYKRKFELQNLAEV